MTIKEALAQVPADDVHAYLHEVVRATREAGVDDYSLVAQLVDDLDHPAYV